MLQAIRVFLAAALDDEPPSIDALVRSLDTLALAYENAPSVDASEDYVASPEKDYRGPVIRSANDFLN